MSEIKRYSRREFLKIAGLTAAGAALEACAPGITKAPTPTRKPTVPNEEIIFNKKGVTVYGYEVNHAQRPTSWQDYKGNNGTFDKDAIENAFAKFRQNPREKLMAISAQRIEVEKTIATPVPDKPTFRELPPDALSKEQLAERGIEIFASPDVGLHIRPQAFAAEELLEHLTPDGRNKLLVVIADYPVLNANAFKDKYYDPIRDIVNAAFPPSEWNDPQKAKEEWLSFYKGRLNIQKTEIDKRVRAIETITTEEILKWGLFGGFTGLYCPEGKEFSGGNVPSQDKAVLFLAIGERPAELNFLTLTAYNSNQVIPELYTFDLQEALFVGPVRTLNPFQSYPSPKDFRLKDSFVNIMKKTSPAIEPNDKTPGFVARHEFAHGHRAKTMVGQDPKEIWSEWETDMDAYHSIERSKAKSGNGDNSGYYFVLENKKEKYFVVT